MLAPLDVVPSRQNPSTFSDDMDGFLNWLLTVYLPWANAIENSFQFTSTNGTSTTSLGITTGSKSLVTQANKAWSVGSYVYLTYTSDLTKLMVGQVGSYNNSTGALVVNVTKTMGSGTYTNWSIGLALPDVAALNLSGGAAGSTPYQSGPNTTAMLAAGAANRIYQSNGAAAPSWVAPEAMVAGADAAGGDNFPRKSQVDALIASGSSALSTSLATYVRSFRQVGQIVSYQSGAMATGSTNIPTDDTIPQQTEGDQYMSVAITPKDAGSTLEIDVTFFSGISTTANLITTVALFKDSAANAIAAAYNYGNGSNNYDGCVTIRHIISAGSTSAQTFKVRAGVNSAGTLTFNGHLGGQLYAGVMASRITIKEYLP